MLTVLSCQKKEEESEVTEPTQKSILKASPPALYALALFDSAGTPVPAGFRSAIYKVDLCSSPIGYTFVSAIRNGLTPVTDVTGICDMPNVPDFAWAVTGMNSNFPRRLLRVRISTGAATIAAFTTVAGLPVSMQDIENYNATGLFVAIREGTSQLMRVNVPGGACVAFAPVGPVAQYNGLTVVGNKFHAISGLTNLICPPNSGDIFEYPIAGGGYTGKFSYKNLPVNGTWTRQELGFYFDNYCNKRWVVGSSSGIISNNTNITPCILPTPIFLRNTFGQNYRYIYDFMVKP
jgi:hypothetical protein